MGNDIGMEVAGEWSPKVVRSRPGLSQLIKERLEVGSREAAETHLEIIEIYAATQSRSITAQDACRAGSQRAWHVPGDFVSTD